MLCVSFAAAAVAMLAAYFALAQRSDDVADAPEASRLESRRPARADVFPREIHALGPVQPDDAETLALAAALADDAPDQPGQMVARVEQFLKAHPDSPYAASLHGQLGKYFRYSGRYSRALEHWEASWMATRNLVAGPGKELADETLAEWGLMLANLGRLDQLKALAQEQTDRVLDGAHLSYLWLRAREKLGRMTYRPEYSYKCGVHAVDNVALALGLKDYDRDGLLGTFSPSPEGFSLTALEELSRQYGLGLRAVRRAVLDEIPVPSVVHWRQEHYAAIIGHQDGWFSVMDTSTGGLAKLRGEEIAEEATGYFLVPESIQGNGWLPVNPAEGRRVVGRGGSSCPPQDPEDPPPSCPLQANSDGCPCETPPGRGGSPDAGPNGPASGGSPNPVMKGSGGGTGRMNGSQQNASGSGQCCGLPVWSVSEPYLNLRINDVPLAYTPARGPDIRLELSYRQRAPENVLSSHNGTSFGKGWHSLWTSYSWDGAAYLPGGQTEAFSYPGGSNMSNPGPRTNAKQERLLDQFSQIIGYAIHTPDGSQLRYTHFGNQYTGFLLKEWIDPNGFKLVFNFSGMKITSIQDQDANHTYLYYADSNNPNCVTSVVAPGGRTVTMTYTSGHLASVTDVVGIASSFAYDANGWATSMTTPYGTTTFALTDFASGTITVDRKAVITEPGGRQHLYAYIDVYGGSDIPAFASGQLPLNTPKAYAGHPYGSIETEDRKYRNTFYWAPQQVQAIGNTAVENFNWSHLKRGRARHWLLDNNLHVDTLNHEQDPSPDGTAEGQITWYDYDGKSYTAKGLVGSQILPAVIARTIPGQSTSNPWYVSYARNSLGHPTVETSTHTTTGGSWGTRSRTLTYAANGIDLLSETDFSANTVREYTWNSVHQMLTLKDRPASGVTYQTTFTYDGSARLSTVTSPAGLLSTYTYDGGGRLQKILDTVSGTPRRTNQLTWLDGNPRTHVDPRGLTRTFTFDALNRLTRIDYSSDSTYEEFRYTDGGAPTGTKRLDVTWQRDRLGKITTYAYNGLRQLTSTTDPLNRTTSYQYCSCGGVSSITDALSQATTFGYDQQGNRTTVTYPDSGGTVTYAYNLLRQMTSRTDSLGARTFEYNNQGLQTVVKNHGGNPELNLVFDINNRPVTTTDANGTALTQTFDWLGRLKTRTWPSGGSAETYNYSERGLTSYVDQTGKTTGHAYDELLRKTSETTPNSGETTYFSYNGADDLLTLTDPKSSVTTWTYDNEGRVTAKQYQGQTFANLTYGYNANHWVTSRRYYANASTYQQTSYTYNDVGRVTLVDYPSGTTDITYAYDALYRLTNMVDAAGTTKFTYKGWGGLATEDGPWGSDTVTYGYNTSRERTSLSLQQPSGTWSQTYGYDGAHRLTSVASPAGTYSYTYSTGGTPAAASRLWTQVTLPNTGKITHGYDAAGRLTSTQLKHFNNTVLDRHDYLYNTRHERTKQTRADASYVDFTYDNLGQLQSARGYTSGGTPLTTEQKGYKYDAGWNLVTRTNNGFNTAFGVDVRNQLTTQPNGTATYDASGNLTADGVRSFTYNAENQLVSVSAGTSYKNDFVYDGLGRARKKLEYIWSAGAWSLYGETRYVMDGRRVVQERNGSDAPQAGYTWGQDVSGSLEGAGGIGGLLGRSHGYSAGTWSTHHHYHADGGGNVTALMDSAQALSANYRYDSYGNLLSSSGAMAGANLMRFSSKLWMASPGLYYYGFRFYEPNFQRWLNRDPLGEEGGFNLYGFVGNNPIDWVDPDGLQRGGRTPGGGGRYGMPGLRQPVFRIPWMQPGSGARRQPTLLEQLIANARREAVAEAWRQERELCHRTGRGTRDWTKSEMQELLNTGKVSGYEGHHINNVKHFPSIAHEPNNVIFRTRTEHFGDHNFDWRLPTTGTPVNRTPWEK